MTKNYLDIQIEKVLKEIKDHNRKTKKLDSDRIRVYLYKLVHEAYKEGVYAGKSK